jgi:hypothetical protein
LLKKKKRRKRTTPKVAIRKKKLNNEIPAPSFGTKKVLMHLGVGRI